MEEWRAIDGYEGLYKVSNLGRVKSLQRLVVRGKSSVCPIKEKILKLHKEKNGYLRCVLCKDKKCKPFLVHRLVALAFIPNPKTKPQVNHKNGIKTFNWDTNLEWSTPKENARHAIETGLNKNRGEGVVTSKLTKKEVRGIKIFLETKNYTQKEIGSMFTISRSTISSIKTGRNWKHIMGTKDE